MVNVSQMNIDTDKIIAQEFAWVTNNEPTFQVNGNIVIGNIGRAPNGDPIRLRILIPEYYPIVKPDVKILTPINHPNIDSESNLALQILDEWEPSYRLKDIISNARRLFLKSSRAIRATQINKSANINHYETEILKLQREIANYNKKITDLKSKQLQKAGVNEIGIGAFKVSKEIDMKCQLLALNDLLELITIKFEEADLDQTDYFRLYRKYIKEKYLIEHEYNKIKENSHGIPEKKKEKPIRR